MCRNGKVFDRITLLGGEGSEAKPIEKINVESRVLLYYFHFCLSVMLLLSEITIL